MPNDNQKYVIFDLDGTLIDSYECVLRCLNKILFSKGLSLLIPHRESIDNLFNRAYSQYNDITPSEFKYLFDVEHNNDTEGIKVISDNYNVLREYYENGIYIVILTNKRQHIAEQICKILFPELNDNLIIIGREGLTPIKEFPELVRIKIVGKGLSIHNCLTYYGDSESDCELSKKLQIRYTKI